MKKRIGAAVAIAALGLMLIPLNHHRVTDERRGGPQTYGVTEERPAPAAEQQIKQQIVANDVQMTNALCRTQCTLAFREAAKKAAGSDKTAAAAKLKQMQAMHPHMDYLVWTQKGEPLAQGVVSGKLDPVPPQTFDSQMALAKQESEAGHEYISPVIQTSMGPYFVLGVPSRDGKASLVGVIHQEILGQVQNHQMKNLRVVPYPAEGNWKIESVKSGTLEDVYVDHPEKNQGTSHYHKNEVVVKFRTPPTDAQLEQIQREIGSSPARKLGYTYVFQSAHMEAKQLIAYFQKWNVEYAEPHYLYMTNSVIPTRFTGLARFPTLRTLAQKSAALVQVPDARIRALEDPNGEAPNDTLYSRYQWNLPIVNTVTGWEVGKGDPNTIIGVVDTGADLNHPDLKEHLLQGYNVVNPGAAPMDDVGHGTHVAGVISAVVNNDEGVAGMTWYNPVLPVKVLDQSGAGSTYAVAQGIIWATDHGAKVINMSLGNYADAQFLHDAVKYAYDHDVVLIAASGNDNTDQPGYPAAYQEVFAVAATDSNKRKASFSNYGDYIDVAAPGVGIASTYPSGQYAALSGTSMASPHVTALAGLIRSINPNLKNTEVMDLMRQTAEDLGTKGKDTYFGYGQIDVAKALQAAMQSAGGSLVSWPQSLQRDFDQLERKYFPAP